MGYEAREDARSDYNGEVASEAFNDGDFDEDIRRLILEGKFDEEVKKRLKALGFATKIDCDKTSCRGNKNGECVEERICLSSKEAFDSHLDLFCETFKRKRR